MHFQVKVQENGRKSIFRKYRTTNKVPLRLLHVEVIMERYQQRFWTYSTNKEGAVYAFISLYEPQNKQ